MNKALGLLSLTGFTLAATSMMASSGYAQQTPTKLLDPMDMGIYYEEIAFEAADTNGDNLISEGEFARDARIDRGDGDLIIRAGLHSLRDFVFGQHANAALFAVAMLAGDDAALRDRLWASIADLGGVGQNGDPARRVAGALNVRFAGVEGESMIMAMKDIAVSSGSACTSASLEPSHVLRAIGLGDELAHASLRFSLGRFSTAEEVALAADAIRRAVTRLRGSAVPEPGMLA